MMTSRLAFGKVRKRTLARQEMYEKQEVSRYLMMQRELNGNRDDYDGSLLQNNGRKNPV